MTKPQITIDLNHPPRLGLNIKKVAFGPAFGRCSDEILDRLSANLISGGVQVVDRHQLRSLLAGQHLSMNGYVDRQSAARLGKALGPAALIMVKVKQCDTEGRRNHSDAKDKKGNVVRTNTATLQMHIRGSLQTVDLSTGTIFSASPISADSELTSEAKDVEPVFPPEGKVGDIAIQQVVYDATTMFLPWTEQKKLYFFNDKECNLSLAYNLLKGGDIQGTIRQSEDNIAGCRTWPNVKDSNVAHAYYNVGLAYLLVSDYERAMGYLRESAKVKSTDICTETMTEVVNSQRLDAEMRSVADRTEAFEQDQTAAQGAAQQPPPAMSGPSGQPAAGSPAEERLKKLDALFKKGLITRQEYEAKRAQILKDL